MLCVYGCNISGAGTTPKTIPISNNNTINNAIEINMLIIFPTNEINSLNGNNSNDTNQRNGRLNIFLILLIYTYIINFKPLEFCGKQ